MNTIVQVVGICVCLNQKCQLNYNPIANFTQNTA